jgi:hypothetical protein
MKTLTIVSLLFIYSAAAYAQLSPAVSPSVTASYNALRHAIEYSSAGDVTKDGLKLIEIKNKALDVLAAKLPLSNEISNAIIKERSSLEALKNRIILQRDRLIKPLPPMQETQ